MRKISFLFLLSAIMCCSKDEERLPDQTTTGIGSFGCKVDNNVWLPNETWMTLYGPMVGIQSWYSSTDGKLTISAIKSYNSHGDFDEIDLVADSIFNVGSYNFLKFHDNAWFPPISFFLRVRGIPGHFYGLTDSPQNKLNIKYFDTLLKIASGTFEMELQDSTGENSVKISNGVFDIVFE